MQRIRFANSIYRERHLLPAVAHGQRLYPASHAAASWPRISRLRVARKAIGRGIPVPCGLTVARAHRGAWPMLYAVLSWCLFGCHWLAWVCCSRRNKSIMATIPGKFPRTLPPIYGGRGISGLGITETGKNGEFRGINATFKQAISTPYRNPARHAKPAP